MNIEELMVGQLRELAKLASGLGGCDVEKPFPFAIGDSVFIRTVTHHQTGRISGIGSDWIKLDDAAWIADDGKFSTALKTGVFNEVEPVPNWCLVGRGAIIDMHPWPHALPREVK